MDVDGTDDQHSDNEKNNVCAQVVNSISSHIMPLILRHQLTSLWENATHAPYTRIKVQKDTFEYKSIEFLFNSTSTGLKIYNIERVQNPYLLGHYLLKREKMKLENGFVHEKTLFHGIQKENIDRICRYNFEWERDAFTYSFGHGICLSTKAAYARSYTCDNIMVLVKVLVSAIKLECNTSIVAPEPFDAIQNWDGNLIIKVDNEDLYPQYIIYFH